MYCRCTNCVGLTLITVDNKIYQELNEESLKKLNKDIIDKVSTIYNIPIEYLLDKDKFVLLEPFVNVCFLSFLTNWSNKNFDQNSFIIKPEILPNKLALFQNLEMIQFVTTDFAPVNYLNNEQYETYDYAPINRINHVFVYEDKMLIFDGDSEIIKYQNIPSNVKYLNIIPTLEYTQIKKISDYNFLPDNIEELNFNFYYLSSYFKHTNLPSTLKIKSNVSYTSRLSIHNVKKNIETYCKLPLNCEVEINVYCGTLHFIKM